MAGFGVLNPDQVSDAIFATRAVQIPLLATLLLGACAAKTRRAIASGSIDKGTGPTAIFPVLLRRPIAIGLFAGEFILGAGLLLTAGKLGAGPPALVIRSATALLFATAFAALHELRGKQPDAGCGCFGDLSDTPVTWRAFVRSAFLCVAAIATIGVSPLHRPATGREAIAVLAVLAIELLVLASLSPEIGEIMVRLGYSEPCEVRRLPVSRTLAALRGSAHWRRYRRYLVSTEPTDVWREGCWRYVVFPGMLASRRVEIVFAVYLKTRRAPVRAGIFDAIADRRAREAAGAPPGPGRVIPPPRRPAVPARPAPIVLAVKAPHGPPQRVPHQVAHTVQPQHDHHRHSASL